MATFCMQTLGCDVAAINTVNFSKEWTFFRRACFLRLPPHYHITDNIAQVH